MALKNPQLAEIQHLVHEGAQRAHHQLMWWKYVAWWGWLWAIAATAWAVYFAVQSTCEVPWWL